MPVDFKPKATSTIQFKPKPVQNSVMPTAVPAQKPWENRAIGVAQSVLGTAVGTARGLQNVGLGIMGAFGADKNKYGLKSLKAGTQEGQAVTAALAPQNTQQQQGKLAGDIAQFVAPTSAINKATAGLSVIPRVLARTAPDVATTVAQNLGADTGQTGVNAGITGITSGVANALIPAKPVRALSTIARTVAPGYVADVATGLAGQRGEDRTGGNAFIPGSGTALSATIGAVGALPQIKHGTQKYLKDRPINKNYKALDTLQKSNKPLDRKIVMADKSGIDTKRILAESNLLAGAVDNNGTINSKVAVSNLNDVLQPWEAKVGDALAVENKRIPLSDVQTKLLSTIDESGLVGSMKQQAQARAMGELQALAMEADEAGTIPLKLVHDLKVQTNRNNAKSFIDPEKNAIGKIVGRGLKEFVETSTDAMDVKTYNQELRKFYALRTVLEALDGKKVEGGRLGKYAAQMVGAVAGNAVGGPVGAVAGSEIAGKIKGAMMSRTFAGSERGVQMQPTKKMLDAIQPPQTSPMIDRTVKSAIPQAISTTAMRTNSQNILPRVTGQSSLEKNLSAKTASNIPAAISSTNIGKISTPVIPQTTKKASTVMPTTKEVGIAKQKVQQLQEQIALQESILKENPASKLMRYVGKGNNSLSEVNYRAMGTDRKGAKLDDLVTELGYKDLDEAQAAIDDYVRTRDSIRSQKEELRKLRGEVRNGEDLISYDTPEYTSDAKMWETQLFAGGAAGFEMDDNGHVTFNPEKALLGMAAMAGYQKLPKSELLKRIRTSIPNQTKTEMADFVTTIKSGAVKTDKDGFLQFATKADERAFEAGMAIVTERPLLRNRLANSTLAKIANLYDEVLTTR